MPDFTSPARINEIAGRLAPYRSEFTGIEYDTAVRVALTLQDYIDAHVQVPFIVFTGDYEEQVITKLERGTWLQSIVTSVELPFSKSAPKYEYIIEYRTEGENPETVELLRVDPQTMMDENLVITYDINREIPPASTVVMRTTSTNAYGRFRVKFIMA